MIKYCPLEFLFDSASEAQKVSPDSQIIAVILESNPKTFVVSYTNIIDNTKIKSIKVQATDSFNAIINAFIRWGETEIADWVKTELKGKTIEEIKEKFLDTDSIINVLEI